MITIHQRNWKVFNNDDTVSKPLQNSLPWVLPDKYITDWHTIQFILSLPVSLCLFFPSTNSFTVWKVSFTGDKQFTNEQISNVNSLHKSKILVLSTIPLLCQIWPGFKQKSSLFLPTKSWNDTNTCALIFLFHLIFLDDKIRTTVQLITCTVPQNCLSLFTISQFTFKTFSTCLVELSGWASDFFVEGRHLSKILLGANVTLIEFSVFGKIPLGVKIRVHNVFYTHTSIYFKLILSTDGSKYR